MSEGQFDFCGEFKDALELMENSKHHIFITGKAGSGKSTLLRYFKDITRKNNITLAPTGIAAVNVDGQTVHSFFSLPLGFIAPDQVKKLYHDKKKIIRNLDVLLIDEASMLRADMFDAIDYSLRINSGKKNIPFGGIRIIMFGDIFQLPPIVKGSMRHIMENYYDAPYFFNAKVMSAINLKCIQLNRIYRQKDNQFIELLGRIRINECTDEDIDVLNERVGIVGVDDEYTTLTTTNNDAENINKSFLKKIKSKEYQYAASVTKNFTSSSCPTEMILCLKKGARVILLNNDKEKRWVNGTIAQIRGITNDSVKISVNGQTYILEKFVWEKIRYTFDESDQEIKEEVIGSFKQYPIKLAWAITIHKSQGQTFEKVVIDIGRGAFSPGQLYVALSRCRSLNGVILKRPLKMSDVIIDDNLHSFQSMIVKTENNCLGSGKRDGAR
ncbi:MAG: AAA family ATPase [Candidatus Omnitrophota bacterium]|nr:AAA family ATPase [Candidatus Omnitrophota bacterium]